MKKKYIDAEKLKQKIESLKGVYKHPNRVIHGVADAFRQDGRVAMCDDIMSEIESLQQERPDVDLEKEFTLWWLREKDNDWAVSFLYENHPLVSKKLARYFYELGLNARKED